MATKKKLDVIFANQPVVELYIASTKGRISSIVGFDFKMFKLIYLMSI